ncbi:MAG TPA: GDSL-type esterase/lipase family protein [Pirellulales bacterium]|jgi:lysophospholipase L1-like esterase|nr:GDSL-type esterase/lipase family protein [Pirellulales bacterium]
MTSELGYAVYIEDYLLVTQPIEGIEVSQFGWHGQTASEFAANLEADVLPFKPTIVMTCFGMVDGGHKALDDEAAQKYRQAQTESVRALKKAGVRTVIVGSPRCVDPLTFRHDRVTADEYNQTLAALADIDREVAAAEGALYADVFGCTLSAMQKAKAQFGQDYVYDPEHGIAAGSKASLVIAYAFLKTLGLAGDVGSVTADFAASRAAGSPDHQVISFADYQMTIESRRYPFWFPGYPAGDDLAAPILKCVPFDDELNRFTLVVKNLPTAQAKIRWHNESADFSAAELAKGVNLAAHFRDTPFAGHMQDVDNAVRDQQQQERISGSLWLKNKEKDLAGLAQRDTFRKRASTRFVPVTHTLRIQPLASPQAQPPGPIPVIVDTDMLSDCDDAGAVALLNTFMNQGHATLLACVANGRDVDLSSGATIQAINAWYGHPAIPIGTYHGPTAPGRSTYTLKTHQHFVPDFPNDDRLPAGVDVYRQALARAADGTVVIASLGYLQNLDDLLKSPPDGVSNLSGLELVRKKVRQIVIMNNQQKEDEFVLAHWPTPILWTMEVGSHIYTGKSLATTPQENPVRFIYAHHGDEQHNSLRDGRQSWDLTASWLAVYGPGELWDVASGGSWKVNTQAGGGEWINGPATNQGFVMVRMPVPEVTRLIEAELSRPPMVGKK